MLSQGRHRRYSRRRTRALSFNAQCRCRYRGQKNGAVGIFAVIYWRSPTRTEKSQPGQPFFLLPLGPFVFWLFGPGLGFWLLAPGLLAVWLAAPMLRPFGLSAPTKTPFGFVRKHAEEVHSSSSSRISRVQDSGSPLRAHLLSMSSTPESGFGSVAGAALTGAAMRILAAAAAMIALKNGRTNFLMKPFAV